MNDFWNDKRVGVLGGAALIGSHVVDQLVTKNCKIKMIDDYSSGRRSNINPNVEQVMANLSNLEQANKVITNLDVVIDLACMHGGRTYVDTHANEMYQNLALDATIFKACWHNMVPNVFFMSSACAYPLSLQKDITKEFKLTEDMLDYKNVSQPDGAYGFSKLAVE